MIMGGKFLLLALLIPASNAADCSADKNNGFEKAECGSGDSKICCHPVQEACITATPKGADEIFECSANRALYGMKPVKIFIIPICSGIFLLATFILMAKAVKTMKPRPAISVLCLVQTLLAVLVVLSPLWKFALYAAFVAVIVFYTTKAKRNQWVLLVLITVQIFNLLAAIGAYGASGTFVPVGLLSSDNVMSWGTGMIDSGAQAGAVCSAYYGNYFNVESVELQDEGADPLVMFHGLCSDGWLAVVFSAIMAKAVIQLFMLLLSMQLLDERLGGQVQEDKELKAAP
jgi:hypothetical protein